MLNQGPVSIFGVEFCNLCWQTYWHAENNNISTQQVSRVGATEADGQLK